MKSFVPTAAFLSVITLLLVVSAVGGFYNTDASLLTQLFLSPGGQKQTDCLPPAIPRATHGVRLVYDLPVRLIGLSECQNI